MVKRAPCSSRSQSVTANSSPKSAFFWSLQAHTLTHTHTDQVCHINMNKSLTKKKDSNQVCQTLRRYSNGHPHHISSATDTQTCWFDSPKVTAPIHTKEVNCDNWDMYSSLRSLCLFQKPTCSYKFHLFIAYRPMNITWLFHVVLLEALQQLGYSISKKKTSMKEGSFKPVKENGFEPVKKDGFLRPRCCDLVAQGQRRAVFNICIWLTSF